MALRRLARRALGLYQEAREHEAAMRAIITAWHPELLGRKGVGPVVAATMFCACPTPGASATRPPLPRWPASPLSTPRRGRPRAGACPRYGYRQLNCALHTVVLSLWRTRPHHPGLHRPTPGARQIRP